MKKLNYVTAICGMCVLLFVGCCNAKSVDTPQGSYADASKVVLWYATTPQIEIITEDGDTVATGNWLMCFGERIGGRVWVVEKNNKGFRYYAPYGDRHYLPADKVSQDIRKASSFGEQLLRTVVINAEYSEEKLEAPTITLHSFVRELAFPYPSFSPGVVDQAVSDLQGKLNGEGSLQWQLRVFYRTSE